MNSAPGQNERILLIYISLTWIRVLIVGSAWRSTYLQWALITIECVEIHGEKFIFQRIWRSFGALRGVNPKYFEFEFHYLGGNYSIFIFVIEDR